MVPRRIRRRAIVSVGFLRISRPGHRPSPEQAELIAPSRANALIFINTLTSHSPVDQLPLLTSGELVLSEFMRQVSQGAMMGDVCLRELLRQ
jgi:hypothetical protein